MNEVIKPPSLQANATSSLKKFMRWFLFIFLVVVGIFIYWKYVYTYSDGYRSGLLQKLSHKGNIFKTYEGELVMNSIVVNGNAPVGSEKFYFSVADEKLGEKMKDYEGKRVVVVYTQKNGTLPWRGDSQYIVDSLKVIEP